MPLVLSFQIRILFYFARKVWYSPLYKSITAVLLKYLYLLFYTALFGKTILLQEFYGIKWGILLRKWMTNVLHGNEDQM